MCQVRRVQWLNKRENIKGIFLSKFLRWVQYRQILCQPTTSMLFKFSTYHHLEFAFWGYPHFWNKDLSWQLGTIHLYWTMRAWSLHACHTNYWKPLHRPWCLQKEKNTQNIATSGHIILKLNLSILNHICKWMFNHVRSIHITSYWNMEII